MPANPPFGRNDIYATNAIAGQLFGRGGGNEVNSAMLLSGLQQRLGAPQGTLLWNDLRERQDPEAPVRRVAFPRGGPIHLFIAEIVLDDTSETTAFRKILRAEFLSSERTRALIRLRE